MQIAHSSRRQHYQQQQQMRAAQRSNNTNTNESSDVDGTAHRVASVTLESDSLSADQPMSFRSKRRKKLPRKEKHNQEMDVDEQHRQTAAGRDGSAMKQSSGECDQAVISPAGGKAIPFCKVQMEWEESEHLQSTSAGNKGRPSASDLENSQQSASELSESTSNADADDEQSDWPDFGDPKRIQSATTRSHQGHQLLQPDQPTSTGGSDAALSSAVIKQVEHFLDDPEQKELLLDQVYRTSAIKQMLRKKQADVQIVKKGRGTVALKKA